MGRGVSAALAFVVLVAAATASAATGNAGTRELRAAPRDQEFVPGELVVRFKPGLAGKARAAILGEHQATVDENLLVPGAALVRLPPGASVDAAARVFEERPDVLAAQPNFVYHADIAPSDPLFGVLWGLNSSGQSVDGPLATFDADIDAPEAWDLTTGSATVRVAVVDTGVEYDHPDLVGNIGTLGWDFYSGDSEPRDENGHGTHVAGTIGANGNNAIGVTGVNWKVDLMPVRVLGPGGTGTTATVANGLVYAAQHGARVVNASLGGANHDRLVESAIAQAPGTLFVVPAGNGGSDGIGDDDDVVPQYPCNYASANIVCVAATDLNDSLAAFSNYGPASVDLAAPGVRIGSTYVAGGYIYMQGTSMATPHVTGVAGLMLARKPAATVAELRAALFASVDVVGSLAGKVATSGRVNAYKAVLAIAPPPPPPPPPPLAPPPAPPPAARRPAETRCVVPNVRGKKLAAARRSLVAGRCALGRVTKRYSPRVRAGRIVSQSRAQRVRLPRGTRVNVVVSRGRRR